MNFTFFLFRNHPYSYSSSHRHRCPLVILRPRCVSFLSHSLLCWSLSTMSDNTGEEDLTMERQINPTSSPSRKLMQIDGSNDNTIGKRRQNTVQANDSIPTVLFNVSIILLQSKFIQPIFLLSLTQQHRTCMSIPHTLIGIQQTPAKVSLRHHK